MTNGMRTSEFFVAILVILAASFLVYNGSLSEENWVWAVGLSTAGYSVSRGLAKKDSV